MAKIILNDDSVDFVSAGVARAMIAKGEARYAQTTPEYSTRMMTAAKPKIKRKRRKKADIDTDVAGSDEAE